MTSDCLPHQVRPSELQGLAFARAATKRERAPHVLRLIEHFNTMSRWVCMQVVRLPTARERARCIKHFVELAISCRELGNFNGVMEIVAALNSSAVYRLKATWRLVTAPTRRNLDELCDLVAPDRSHAALRSAMRRASSRPAVPYLGLYLTGALIATDDLPCMQALTTAPPLAYLSLGQVR